MALNIELSVLEQMPLFTGIPAGKLKLIAFAGQRISCNVGEVLFRQGEESDSVYIVLNGQVAVYREGKKRVLLAQLGVGEIIGEIGVLCDRFRTATVEAGSDVTVLRLEKDVFMEFVNELPPLALAIIRELSDRLVRMNQQLEKPSAH